MQKHKYYSNGHRRGALVAICSNHLTSLLFNDALSSLLCVTLNLAASSPPASPEESTDLWCRDFQMRHLRPYNTHTYTWGSTTTGTIHDSHKQWPWWPQTMMTNSVKVIQWCYMSLTVHLALVFHIFIAALSWLWYVAIVACGRHGISSK